MSTSYEGLPPMKECNVVIIFSDIKNFDDIEFYGKECNQPHLFNLKKSSPSLGKIKASGKKANNEQQFVVLFCLDGDNTQTHLRGCCSSLSKLPIKKAYISYKDPKCAELVTTISDTTNIKLEVFEVVSIDNLVNEGGIVLDVLPFEESSTLQDEDLNVPLIDIPKIEQQFKQEVEKILSRRGHPALPKSGENSDKEPSDIPATSAKETNTEVRLGNRVDDVADVKYHSLPEDYDFYKWVFDSLLKSTLFNRTDLEQSYQQYVSSQKKIKCLREAIYETNARETDALSETDVAISEKDSDIDKEESYTHDSSTDESPSWKTSNLIDYVLENTIDGYESFFDELVENDALDDLSSFLQKEAKKYDIFPPMKDVFAAFELCPLKNIKVVILGQNPYHTPGAAMGLAFSHHPDRKSVQPSLRNIYACLKHDGFKVETQNGDLSNWAIEGVFLLNTGLTVRKGEPDSHLPKGKEKGPWSYFTESLLRYIDTHVDHFVVILWGNTAKDYEKFFDASKHHIIKAPHPAASIYKKKDEVDEFLVHKPFSRANTQLKKWNMEPIDWNL